MEKMDQSNTEIEGAACPALVKTEGKTNND